MRLFLAAAAVLMAVAAWAQPSSPPITVFLSVKPDVFVTVKKHPMGADMVEIVPANTAYPATLLAEQIAALGRYGGSEPRGVRILRYSPDAANPLNGYLKAQFAVDGIIDRGGARLRIAPILKAFAGAPAPYTVHGVFLVFDGEAPTDRTIRRFESSSIRAEAVASRKPIGIEYRIELLSQDPAQIAFPEQHAPPSKATEPGAPSDRRLLLWTLTGIAAVAGGALVYLALLRAAGQARSTPKP